MRWSTRCLAGLVVAVLSPAAGPVLAQGFQSLYTRDGIDVIAVGDNGETYRSLNGGDSWTGRVIGSPALGLRRITGRGLAMLMVSDGGIIWASADGGGNWTSSLVALSPNLKAAAMPAESVWVVVGAGGTIARTTDAGAHWAGVGSGTVQDLNSIRFADAQHGWIAGNLGTLLTTADGGASWMAVPLATTNALLSVDQRGATVWVVGAEGAAWRSTNGGAGFSPVALKLDARADVRCVTMLSPDSLYITGGGGFIRFTANGGATWTYLQHGMHAPVTDLIAYGTNLWAANSKNRIVMVSIDRGGTWRFPTGATSSLGWGGAPKYAFGGQVRGSSFALNPVFKSTLYCGLGTTVLRSRDDGETWQSAATLPSGYNKFNAFVVSPRDSNLWLAAVSGGTVSDRVYRTTDGGSSWTIALTHGFGEYGIPLEPDPDRPDTVWFGGEANPNGSPVAPLYRSTNFGASWDSIPAAMFRSPCDIVVVPDTTGVIIVGDGVTGVGQAQYLKSNTDGQSFVVTSTRVSSEIPGMAISRLRPNVIFGTNWSTGGVQRSTDYGDSWLTVDATTQAWGIDIARDDPNVVMFGQYSSPYNAFLSLDGGSSFTSIAPASGNNYSFYLRDRGTIFMEQSSGIWKLQPTYGYTPGSGAQALQLSSPVGGEVWAAGSMHTITWLSSNIALARIEYQRSPGDAWQLLTTTGGYLGGFAWQVPYDATTQARIRISDLWDAAPFDSSGAGFTILTPRIEALPAALDFGSQGSGSATVLSLALKNTGTAALTVTSVAPLTGAYAAGRTSLTIAAGQQDTVGVWFLPPGAGSFPDTLAIASDDALAPIVRVPLTGTAVGAAISLLAPNGGEDWAAGSTRNITWSSTLVSTVALDYRVAPDSAWIPIVAGLPAAPATYAWTVAYRASQSAAVRVRGTGGTSFDMSDAPFTLRSPIFACSPGTVHLPDVQVGYTGTSPVYFDNPGNAPLTISPITVGNPEFWVGRRNLVIGAGSSDSVGVYYRPAAAGADTVTLTISTNEPGSPRTVVAVARGLVSLAAESAELAAFSLGQNRPNPFSNVTFIQYTLPRESVVTLDVFDLRGQRVAMLVNGPQAAGRHEARFGADAHGAGGASPGRVPAGVYFYRLQAGSQSTTRKMLLVH